MFEVTVIFIFLEIEIYEKEFMKNLLVKFFFLLLFGMKSL